MGPMMPRFIISVRELYDRDLRRGQGVDTGFGVLSQPIAGQNAPLSAISFTGIAIGQDQIMGGDANDSEAIRIAPVGDNMQQV